MLYTDFTLAAPAVAAQIAQATHILVLTHVNPDGDAIGSLLGVTHVLRALGKRVTAMPLPPLPEYTAWLPGIETVQPYAPAAPLPEGIDLLFVVDTASIDRMGRVYAEHRQVLDQLPMIVVDHHVTNDGRGTINLIQPAAASSCELLYALFAAMGVLITA
ncbi:MAG: DHH family phosphoesterase, partial [Roseiflexaceae bacterium]|nr:DHH family phosphoesterase [Roseiflexaceae bacterium]